MDEFVGLVLERVAQRVGEACTVPPPAKPLLESVWNELSADLARLVAALGVDPARADDVLQDVYLAAWQKQPAGLDRTELRRWLLRVTTNRANLEHRRRSRWHAALERLGEWGGRKVEPADADAVRREARAEVRRVLAGLEPRLRTVLVLRYFAEYDSTEIGK